MKYTLRSLMIVTMLAPPVLAGTYFVLGTLNIVELRTLLVFGMGALVFVASLSAAFRGEM